MSTLTAKASVFTGPRAVEVREVEVPTPGPGEIRVATMFSGISAGTEMNVYRGRSPQWRQRFDTATRLFIPSDQPEWTYPHAYGYANVGRVVDLGEDVTSMAVGDLVFTYSPHQSAVVAPGGAAVRLPEGIEPR